jgi:hypothetical protein
MALAITCVICGTWLVSLALLVICGFPTITKHTSNTEYTQQFPEPASTRVLGFSDAKETQTDPDAEQEELRKTISDFDIAAAVNAFIEGDNK